MRRFVLRLIVAILAFIIGLSASTIEMPSPAYDVVLHCDSSNVRSHSESLSQQITEISLEREGCDGPCPVYSVVFHKDGTATYTGIAYVQLIGQYRAKPYSFNFERLATWVEGQGYFAMQDRYAEGWVDAEVVTTSLVRNGARKTVMTYNSGEPPLALWGINATIDGIVSRIEWEKLE